MLYTPLSRMAAAASRPRSTDFARGLWIAPGQTCTLAAGQFLRLARLRQTPPGLSLQVRQGAVWVTWDGCGVDHFLAPGQSLALPEGVRGLLLTCEPRLVAGAAQLSLLPAVKASTPQPRSGPVDSRPLWPTLLTCLRLPTLTRRPSSG